ncbi:MAG TPA: type II secretion system protein GspJ [Methylomirabilota bacterium]|nr:type II secretion system protein GspJ [Methylomirabilota bacterium]
MTPRPARGAAGFTLVEVLIALALVAGVLAVALGAARVGLAAWRQGDARAEGLQHARSLALLLDQVISTASPYRIGTSDGGRLAFEGEPERLAFVTTAPAVPPAAPIAFVALRLERDEAGLAIHQGLLPALDPLADLTPALRDGTVRGVRFRYRRTEDGTWSDRWSGANQQSLPAAVEVTLTTARGPQPPVIIPLRTVAQ